MRTIEPITFDAPLDWYFWVTAIFFATATCVVAPDYVVSSIRIIPGMSNFSIPTGEDIEQAEKQLASNTKIAGTDFELAMQFTRKWEGGAIDHPNDPGGRTGAGGILQGEYNRYRKSKGLPTQDVFKITEPEVKDIYKDYWNRFDCGKYAVPLSASCFDSFINFNPQTAASFMKKLPSDPVEAAKEVVKRRMAFRHKRVAQNRSQSVFLKGWLNRDNDLFKYVEQIKNRVFGTGQKESK